MPLHLVGTSKLILNGVTVFLPLSLYEEQENLMTHTVNLKIGWTLYVASADLFPRSRIDGGRIG